MKERILYHIVQAIYNSILLQLCCDFNFFDFDYFYSRRSYYNKAKQHSVFSETSNKPQNAGKLWSEEEEQLLIRMYRSGATKREMCDRFGRTENGLAARLVRLGIIEDRKIFYNKE